MIENLPPFISTVFIITTFMTVGIFLLAVKKSVFDAFPAKLISFLLAFWLIFQAFAGLSGFYQKTGDFPPRLVLYGIAPALLTIVSYLVFFGRDFVDRLPLKTLTPLHVVRIPVEIVLFWLFEQKAIPVEMTFYGRNFDLFAGLTAPLVCWLAFREGKPHRAVLIVWNLFALALLINVATHAVLSLPSAFQQIALARPNRAVLYFPFVWLPTVVVPLVLFAHLAALRRLFKSNRE